MPLKGGTDDWRANIVPDMPSIPIFRGLPKLDRRDIRFTGPYAIPLGPSFPIFGPIRRPEPSIHTVVPAPPTVPSGPLLTKVVRKVPVPTKKQLPMPSSTVMPTGFFKPVQKVTAAPKPYQLPDWYLENFKKGRGSLAPAQIPIVPPVIPKKIVAPPIVQPLPQPIQLPVKAPTMGLDLGNILTTLGGQYIDARYNTPVPSVIPVSGVSPFIPDALEPLLYGPEQILGAQCVPPAPKGYHYNRKGCLTKNRRRRKRLATASDIKDLNALRTVLGPTGVKTWIATH